MVRHRRSPRPRIFIRGIGFPALTRRKAGQLRLQTRGLIARNRPRCQIARRRRPTEASRASSTWDVQRKLKRNLHPAFTTVPRPSKRTEPAATRMRAERYRGGTPICFCGSAVEQEHGCLPNRSSGCNSRLPHQFRVASIAAMQRSLKPQSTGRHRGDPPSCEQVGGWAGEKVGRTGRAFALRLSPAHFPTFPPALRAAGVAQ